MAAVRLFRHRDNPGRRAGRADQVRQCRRLFRNAGVVVDDRNIACMRGWIVHVARAGLGIALGICGAAFALSIAAILSPYGHRSGRRGDPVLAGGDHSLVHLSHEWGQVPCVGRCAALAGAIGERRYCGGLKADPGRGPRIFRAPQGFSTDCQCLDLRALAILDRACASPEGWRKKEPAHDRPRNARMLDSRK